MKTSERAPAHHGIRNISGGQCHERRRWYVHVLRARTARPEARLEGGHEAARHHVGGATRPREWHGAVRKGLWLYGCDEHVLGPRGLERRPL